MSHRPGDASPLMARLTEAARAQDEAALALIKDRTTLDPDRVHDLRVTVKRLRALWRLAGTQGPRKLADKQDKRLRAAAKSLAGARDLQVMGETLDALRGFAVGDRLYFQRMQSAQFGDLVERQGRVVHEPYGSRLGHEQLLRHWI